MLIIMEWRFPMVFPRSYPFNQKWIKVVGMKQLKELVLAAKNRLKWL